MPGGRPTKYSEKLAERLCAQISSGRSVTSLCDEKWAPDETTFYRWVRENDQFYQMYTRARECQSDCYMDRICEIADTEQDANKARVRIEARRIFAEKCHPRKYSPKQQIEHSGSIAEKTDEELDARIAELLGKAGVVEPAAGEEDS